MKLSDTWWRLDEGCVKEICKELPPLLQTLSQSYELSGDSEVNNIYSLLASLNSGSSSYFLSEVLSALALLNLFVQKKIADFSKLPFMFKCKFEHLNSIRETDAIWCTTA